MKLKKGDNIIVRTGKDKGKTGKIERVYPKKNTVRIAGINIYKRHIKRRDEKNPGGIIDIPRPIDASKVALVDPVTKTATRIGYTLVKGEKKRITKKGNKQI
ncbi:MAG: 50S ribosomal protein L24 [Microgenomates group bacterium GW2011_GWC1_41_8]|uniref:Large ribosomal subunit protein uL24 n=3 Tax=Candidatus Roizmaniibacteriota TaxID=1752723 RepID=A0A0G0X519_9BACT|nr:MAG: 50S ribosomal protein L24 [Candidatus Roizmanbacteria bacterium GW2011_GWB1_40_7]KKR94564.1 MAG: 50S ribosomal protein L24 [Candidatus Roizmanbacteria bacterium GW2011_GWA1_41_13]KKS19477.1 MAG: 50S ribosomal protein L24 [Candidatus Roizmanbacteria bacterium GW2011_GWC2_41_7]KKS24252.1 MAG: 50S ribosomal protein L24 [Microgenomates group bacterium GW2011_GWC1_41_8]OGK48416.1 MAG: 50S ribosomal protein L24 [Candidatus Roizmanbacteria bacterium RIFCSPLOWO2_01_FULL_40_14]